MIGKRGIVLLSLAWGLATVGGFLALAQYKNRPGVAPDPPEQWPAESTLTRTAAPTLVMFAHPMCPCTRASLTELQRLLERLHGRLAAQVVFDVAGEDAAEWRASDLWAKARALDGVKVVEDPGGQEAGRFGVQTSGGVVLYDASGRLRFRGGLTIARGHEGESPGADRITAIMNGAAPERDDAPVFGCSLEKP